MDNLEDVSGIPEVAKSNPHPVKPIPIASRFRILIISAGCWIIALGSLPAQTLREAAANFPGLRVGAAIKASSLGGQNYANTVRYQFNLPSPENDTKWGSLRPSQNTFAWSAADANAAFARAAGQQIRGHTLLWHNSIPAWLTGGGFTTTAARDILFDHIDTVAARYQGDVYCWDVVNEAFNDNGSLRDTFWYNSPGIGYAANGTRYIEETFIRTAAADPEALMFYNDYGAEVINAKSDAIHAMAQDFLTRGVPLDGIGFQMHIAGINYTSLRANLKRFNDLGLDLHITEMDVRIPVDANGDATQTDLDAQAEIYWNVLGVALGQPRFKAFQTWGFTDNDSWIPGFFPGYGAALLFDETYQRKPAYWAVWNALANQAEKLTVLDSSAGDSTNEFSQETLSAGAGRQLVANGTGDFMTLAVAVPAAGQWNVKIGYRQSGASGKFQLAVAPEGSGSFTNVGGVVEAYDEAVGTGATDLGDYTFPIAGNWRFRFTVAGRNADSSDHHITLDTIRITPVGNGTNTPPTVSNVTDKNTNAMTPAGPFSFTVGDAQTTASALTVQAISLNPALLPTANIVLGGSGANRTVTLTPAAYQSGSAAVLLLVSDGVNTTPESFTLNVTELDYNRNWTRTTTGTHSWSTATSWLPAAVPTSSPETRLRFMDGITLNAGTVTPNNNLAGTFSLNALTLGGTGASGAASGVTLSGSALSLATRPSDGSPPEIRLDANKSAAANSSLVYTVTHNITLADNTTVTGNGNADFTFSGSLGGPGNLTMSAGGHLKLSGTNTCTGTTTISSGILDVGPTANGSLGGGGLLFSGGVLQGNGSFTRPLSGVATAAAGQISGVTGGFAAKGGQLTLDLGTAISLSNGNFRFGTNFIFGSATADSLVRLTSNIDFGGANRTVTVIPGTGGDAVEFSGVVSNGATPNLAFIKAGGGLLVLSGNNTNTGTTTINAGTLRIAHNNALGTGTVLLGNTDSVLELADGITINRHLTVSDTGNKKTIRIHDEAAIGEYAGSIAINESTSANFELSSAAGQTLRVSGKISGTAGAAVNKRGAGTLALTAPNDYTTPTIISGGVLVANTLSNAGSPGSIGAASDISGNLVINGGTLRHDAANVASTNRKFALGLAGGTLDSSAAAITDIVHFSTALAMGFNSQLGARTLTLTGSNPGDNLLNMDLNDDSAGHPTSVVKEGSGKWQITGGSNEYTGDTTILAGTLVLADNAGLKFLVTDSHASSISGSGTVILNGDFNLNTTAVTAATGTWTLVNAATLTETFGSSFTVAGWTEIANTWTKIVGTRTWSFSEETGVLALTVTGETSYDMWINSFTGISLADRDPGDDPDRDGSSNILEFALNGDPSDASHSGLISSLVQDSSSPASNELTLILAVRDGATFAAGAATVTGITYTVEGSLGLAFPSSAVSSTGPSDSAPAVTGLPSLAGTAWEYHTFKLDASEGLTGKGFLRLKLTQP